MPGRLCCFGQKRAAYFLMSTATTHEVLLEINNCGVALEPVRQNDHAIAMNHGLSVTSTG